MDILHFCLSQELYSNAVSIILSVKWNAGSLYITDCCYNNFVLNVGIKGWLMIDVWFNEMAVT